MSYIGSKPANKPVVASDLDPTIITGQTALATSPADTDEFLISDAGVLKRLDASLIGGGKVLQVVSVAKTDTFTTTSTSKTDITGMTVNITPSATSSKIFITASINYGGNNYNFFCDLLKNTTALNVPASGNNPCTIGLSGVTGSYQIYNGVISYLDSPNSTSELTYKLQIAVQNGGTFRLNVSERNSSVDPSCSSTITAYEIAG